MPYGWNILRGRGWVWASKTFRVFPESDWLRWSGIPITAAFIGVAVALLAFGTPRVRSGPALRPPDTVPARKSTFLTNLRTWERVAAAVGESVSLATLVWGIVAAAQGGGAGAWKLVALGAFGAIAMPVILIWRRERRTPQGYGRRQVHLTTIISGLLGISLAVLGAIEVTQGDYRGIYLLGIAVCAFVVVIRTRALARGWGREGQ